LGLETHVQHAIGLIQNEVLDVLEGDTASLDQIDETTGGSDEQIAATLDLAKLGANVGTTVHDTGANPGAVGELAGLIENLGDQLTSGSQNEGSGIGLALTAVAELATTLGRGGRRAVLESLRQDGEEETTSLTRTGLGTSHEITAAHDNRDRVLLNGSRSNVAGETNVGDKVVIEGRVGEGVDGFRDVVTGGFDGDIIIVGEVDTSLLLGRVVGDTEELTLDASVSRTGNVLAVAPLAITRATALLRATSTSTSTSTSISTTIVTCRAGRSVSTWIESSGESGLLVSLGGPVGLKNGVAVEVGVVITIGGAARAEVGSVSVGPVATARTTPKEIWG
jgi:hypothetical protein